VWDLSTRPWIDCDFSHRPQVEKLLDDVSSRSPIGKCHQNSVDAIPLHLEIMISTIRNLLTALTYLRQMWLECSALHTQSLAERFHVSSYVVAFDFKWR